MKLKSKLLAYYNLIQIRYRYQEGFVSSGKVKNKWLIEGLAPSYEEKMKEINKCKPLPDNNIGFPSSYFKKDTKRRIEKMKNNNGYSNFSGDNKSFILRNIENEWLLDSSSLTLRNIAQHYGIFKDLFDEVSYFVPWIHLNVEYIKDDEVTKVYFGNIIKPFEAKEVPVVNFEYVKNSLWTLILTNPDGHLTLKNKEYLHWFLGNIPSNDISKADIVCPYLQPISPRNTGYHRMIFILYKQEGRLNFDEYQKPNPCFCLNERTFSTFEFYEKYQDYLTPAGLAFYQSDYDSSLTDFYHHVLKMKEPIYEYKFPPPYFAPQRFYPGKKSFNNFLDMHRDRKEIEFEVVSEKLQEHHPFQIDKPKYQFPLVHRELWYFNKPNWLRLECRKKLMKLEKYRNDL